MTAPRAILRRADQLRAGDEVLAIAGKDDPELSREACGRLVESGITGDIVERVGPCAHSRTGALSVVLAPPCAHSRTGALSVVLAPHGGEWTGQPDALLVVVERDAQGAGGVE